MDFPCSGAHISPLLLVGIGIAVGILSGFFGFGGGFITTPALNLFGFPMAYATGTDMTQMAGSGFLSTMRHRVFGHVDFRMAINMTVGTMIGVEVGKRMVLYLEKAGNVDIVIRWVYIIILAALGLFMFIEARKAVARKRDSLLGQKEVPKEPSTGFARRLQALNLPPMINYPVSGIRMSIWVILAIGFATGVFAGLLGVGGGFIRMPTLVYCLGVPTVVAVGTDLFEVIISGAYGSLTYATSHRVELLAALIVLAGASIGVQIGARATRYVVGDSIRYFFSVTLLLAGASILLKQLAAIYKITPLNTASTLLLLGAAGGMSMLIVVLFLINRRRAAKTETAKGTERALVMKSSAEGH